MQRYYTCIRAQPAYGYVSENRIISAGLTFLRINQIEKIILDTSDHKKFTAINFKENVPEKRHNWVMNVEDF